MSRHKFDGFLAFMHFFNPGMKHNFVFLAPRRDRPTPPSQEAGWMGGVLQENPRIHRLQAESLSYLEPMRSSSVLTSSRQQGNNRGLLGERVV